MSVPSSTVQEQSPHVGSILRVMILCVSVLDNKIKAECVDGYGIFPGIVLHHARQESLSEEKSGDPEYLGFGAVVPCL